MKRMVGAVKESRTWSSGAPPSSGAPIISSIPPRSVAGLAKRCAVAMTGLACAIPGCSAGVGRLAARSSGRCA